MIPKTLTCETAEQKERANIREQIEHNIDNINVVVTTYGMAKAKLDNRFLRHLNFGVCLLYLEYPFPS